MFNIILIIWFRYKVMKVINLKYLKIEEIMNNKILKTIKYILMMKFLNRDQLFPKIFKLIF